MQPAARHLGGILTRPPGCEVGVVIRRKSDILAVMIDKWLRLIFVGMMVACSARAELASPAEAGQVGMAVSKLLEEHHYNAKRLDDTMAKEMLKNYLNALDYNHFFFLQSDVDGFQHFSTELDEDLIVGDVQPALAIYRVFSNRLEQASLAIKDLLQENYAFVGPDTLVIDRHESPWPATELERRELLRQHVKFELLEERLNKEKPDAAIKIIKRRYDTLLRNLHETDLDTITGVYLNSLAELYDPHTQYLPPSSAEDFAINMRLSLSGIGAVLESKDGYAKIVSLVPGGPAALDKRLKVNDRIVSVAQADGPMVDVVDMKLNRVVQQIRGKKGTQVRLRIIPGDSPDSSMRSEISLIRDEIKLTEQEAKAKIITQPTPGGPVRLGYLDLPSFYLDQKGGADGKSSARDVRKLLEKLQAEKIAGLVLDLRQNTGGSLQEAIALTGLFIDEGPVVQVKDPQGRISVGRDPEHGVAFAGPMVVLVNHSSASASEILAAALQDYGRALIVGDQATFGKGTVQQLLMLDELLPLKHHDATGVGQLKLTIQKFYRVSGGSTQSHGVTPDIVLPSMLDAVKFGENHLPHFLPYDEIPAVPIARWNQPAPPLAALRQRATERVAHDPEFRYIMDDTDRLKAKSAEKTVALNEAARLAEKLENENRAAARKAERAARHVIPYPTTEITLASLTGSTNQVAAITRKVLETADQNSKADSTKPPAAPDDTPPAPDPIYNEGLNILADYIQLLGNQTAKN